jgi:hypothetical protein
MRIAEITKISDPYDDPCWPRSLYRGVDVSDAVYGNRKNLEALYSEVRRMLSPGTVFREVYLGYVPIGSVNLDGVPCGDRFFLGFTIRWPGADPAAGFAIVDFVLATDGTIRILDDHLDDSGGFFGGRSDQGYQYIRQVFPDTVDLRLFRHRRRPPRRNALASFYQDQVV